ncbi:MAG: fatty acid cis/trans isomerase [Spongiibacteraceae bacterium]
MIWPKLSAKKIWSDRVLPYWKQHGARAWLLVLPLAVLVSVWALRDTAPVAPPPALPEQVPAVVIPPAVAVEFHRDIKPIFENRCAVCHGCYDAPCQLKLDSPEGVLRGATKARVYESTRLLEAPLTRLFVDAQNTDQWRQKEFFSVVYEGEAPIDALARLDGSLLYRMLALKQANPMPKGPARERFELGLDRREYCPKPEEFDKYAREHPQWGMPYALPGIGDDEFNTVKRWLEAGSPVAERPPLERPLLNEINDWERFLNDGDLKTQLLARYVYEHLFLADLYFPDLAIPAGNQPYFKLVRSRTAPGQPLDIIATRRPYDDPGVERVYYRLQPVHSAILAKTHLPYALNEKRRQRWRELFLDPKYDVAALPSYAPDVAANPFVAFHDLPVRARYKFLLDDAGFTIGNFIKGPVCRGQIALNVLDDRFWVMFADPDVEAMVDADFLARESDNLRLPAAVANKKIASLQNWQSYARLQGVYLTAKSKFLHAQFGRPDAVTPALLWKGDGFSATANALDKALGAEKNANAALTVFRHFDSASVVPGWIGDTPKTAWVIDYPLLERMHYLLVAGFDVYGDGSHQLLTRLYMDFLRMEAEYNFLYFLPQKKREAERSSWYQGVGANLRDSVYRQVPTYSTETGMVYKTRDVKREFFTQMRTQLGAALDTRYVLAQGEGGADELSQLQKLAALRGRPVALLPEVVFLRVVRKGAPDEAYTLLHNSDYANVAVLLLDRERRRPQFDTLTVVPGFIGAYPNAFWRVTENELPELVKQLSAVRTPQDYRNFAQRYAIGRDNEKFWPYSDWMHRLYREREPVAWGLFDFNRYE